MQLPLGILPIFVWSLSIALGNARHDVAFDLAFGDDSDLTSFVSRPEIKVPVLRVTKHESQSVAPGYIFAAPFARLYQENAPKSFYQPCQTGPTIYDSDGDLVWTGACKFKNKNTADFRPAYYNGSWHLTAIETGLQEDSRNSVAHGRRKGFGYILDDHYHIEGKVQVPKSLDSFNLHEFLVVDEGKSAVTILHRPHYVDVSMVAGVDREGGWIDNMGFQEVDVASGDPKFTWWAADHIDLTESTKQVSDIDGPPPKAWDYVHVNSVDKTPAGDYLVSARNTDSILLVSGTDGSVKWRLGGSNSSFALEGFDFRRQHDARYLTPDRVPFRTEAGLEYISIFNNAADSYDDDDAEESSVVIAALDTSRWTARIVRKVERPDGGLSLFSGNSYFLGNGNLFTAWGTDSYASEHAHNGRLVMEAEFVSNRFMTYRMFKGDFSGMAEGAPALHCAAYGTSAAKATTVCWVTWNGATRVRSWRFRSASLTNNGSGGGDNSVPLATVARAGFETRVQIRGFQSEMYVEALDENEQILGVSPPGKVRVVQPWADEDGSNPDHTDLR